VELWSVADLRFSDTYRRPVRVVQSQEAFTGVVQRGKEGAQVRKQQQ
jgi:hypothetical protein